MTSCSHCAMPCARGQRLLTSTPSASAALRLSDQTRIGRPKTRFLERSDPPMTSDGPVARARAAARGASSGTAPIAASSHRDRSDGSSDGELPHLPQLTLALAFNAPDRRRAVSAPDLLCARDKGDPDDNQPDQQDGWMLDVEDELSASQAASLALARTRPSVTSATVLTGR